MVPPRPGKLPPRLPESLARDLARQSVVADTFLNFTLLPVVAPLPADMLPADNPQATQAANAPAPSYVMIHDQRFGISLAIVHKIMNMRPSADIPFKYMAELAPAPQPAESDTLAENPVQESTTTAGPIVSTIAAFPQRLLREPDALF